MARSALGIVLGAALAVPACADTLVGKASHPRPDDDASHLTMRKARPWLIPAIRQLFADRYGGWMAKSEEPWHVVIFVTSRQSDDEERLASVTKRHAHRFVMAEVRYSWRELGSLRERAHRLVRQGAGWHVGISLGINKLSIRATQAEGRQRLRELLDEGGIPRDAYYFVKSRPHSPPPGRKP